MYPARTATAALVFLNALTRQAEVMQASEIQIVIKLQAPSELSREALLQRPVAP